MAKAKVVPDEKFKGMYRVKLPNGELSDYCFNLSRANQYAEELNEKKTETRA